MLNYRPAEQENTLILCPYFDSEIWNSMNGHQLAPALIFLKLSFKIFSHYHHYGTEAEEKKKKELEKEMQQGKTAGQSKHIGNVSKRTSRECLYTYSTWKYLNRNDHWQAAQLLTVTITAVRNAVPSYNIASHTATQCFLKPHSKDA